jgi:putative colanic acid biosynthesis UDP-glucose lipid carrier transferase
VIKIVEDYVLAAFLVVLLLPLLMVIAIAIWLDSPGPFLFRQKRLGFNNEVFNVYKFRTMWVEPAPQEKTIQVVQNDARVTALGSVLRRWSLDELPQLFNVLNGSMSLVGPRPHAIDHKEEFAREVRGYFARHRVKPGITGLAQIRGFRGPTDTLEKIEGRVRSDIEYTERWSLTLDLEILLKTLLICIQGKNAY